MMANNFYTVPNQRVICIPEEGKNKCGTSKDNLYAKIQIKGMFAAMKSMTPRYFQVWLWLAKNQKGYVFAFSPTAVMMDTGISKDTVQKAAQFFIENGYLVKRDDGSEIYDFYETPKEETLLVCKK